jgi:hypothetical protein
VAATEKGEPAGPDDEQEAQGAHAADRVRTGAFAGAGFARGQGIELEAPSAFTGRILLTAPRRSQWPKGLRGSRP